MDFTDFHESLVQFFLQISLLHVFLIIKTTGRIAVTLEKNLVFSIFLRHLGILTKIKKIVISQPSGLQMQIWGHFPFFNLKCWRKEKKVPLFFGFVASGLRYYHFVILLISSIWSQTKKMRKWQYLSPDATNLKNEGTLFS